MLWKYICILFPAGILAGIASTVAGLVGAYTGYFGAAGGAVMLAVLAASSPLEFAEYNALKNLSLDASNFVAAILFAFRAHIYLKSPAFRRAEPFLPGAGTKK